MRKLVGNGMAGMLAVEELLKPAPDLYDITVFGAAPHGNSCRIRLSPLLAGEMTIQNIILNPLQWWADNDIGLCSGKTLTKIDRTACCSPPTRCPSSFSPYSPVHCWPMNKHGRFDPMERGGTRQCVCTPSC